jgi:hypothetical protein
MIAAFARMARLLGGLGMENRDAAARYLQAARHAAEFLHVRMWNAETRTLLRRYRAGHAEIDAYAEDYAYLVAGLLDLFQADPDPEWLDWAIALQHRQDELFWDDAEGGWFSTTGLDPSVLLRMKEDYDGAEPTASSISVLNLLWLSHLAPDAPPAWADRIDRTLRLFGARLEQIGRAVPMMAAALSTRTAGVQQVVIVEGENAGANLERTIALRPLPFAIVLRVNADQRRALAGRLPFVAAMQPVNGATAVYLCRNFTCAAPVTTVEQLEGALA